MYSFRYERAAGKFFLTHVEELRQQMDTTLNMATGMLDAFCEAKLYTPSVLHFRDILRDDNDIA